MSKGENGPLRDKRGISPVVATVILVAVTIVVAVAVAYWMGGIAGLYTRFERIEISSAYAVWNATSNVTGKGTGEWKISVNLKNTGSADATITGLLVNGKPWNDAYFGGNVSDPSLPVSVPTGQEKTITFYISLSHNFSRFAL